MKYNVSNILSIGTMRLFRINEGIIGGIFNNLKIRRIAIDLMANKT